MASPDQTSSADPSLRRTPENPSPVLAARIVDAMADKRAMDISVIDLREVSSMADFFVLGTGESDLQVKAIANGIADQVEATCGERPWKREGTDHLQWVVLDYVDVVAHVFLPEKREHYRIDRLWGEADSEIVPEDGDASDLDLLQDLLQKSSDPA
ncbi:ribosome silencing factor [Salinibacter grassmerensis]|uniref:ribosome silencing factor n=1 Tax=Salinibacter grassmerensis TaxID=3040353 RepID=UPI0021E799C8|nr:ribosome silencing factor [Salinibacter grassmerensis]